MVFIKCVRKTGSVKGNISENKNNKESLGKEGPLEDRVPYHITIQQPVKISVTGFSRYHSLMSNKF